MNHEQTVCDRVRAVVVKALELPLDPDELPADEPLFGEGAGADSIDSLQIVFGIEREFGIQVTDSELTVELFDSVATLAAYVERKLGTAAASPAPGAPPADGEGDVAPVPGAPPADGEGGVATAPGAPPADGEGGVATGP